MGFSRPPKIQNQYKYSTLRSACCIRIRTSSFSLPLPVCLKWPFLCNTPSGHFVWKGDETGSWVQCSFYWGREIDSEVYMSDMWRPHHYYRAHTFHFRTYPAPAHWKFHSAFHYFTYTCLYSYVRQDCRGFVHTLSLSDRKWTCCGLCCITGRVDKHGSDRMLKLVEPGIYW